MRQNLERRVLTMEMYDKPEIERIIKKAKDKYPISFQYTGRLYEKELSDIEKECNVKCSSVCIDGTATYYFRYKGGVRQ